MADAAEVSFESRMLIRGELVEGQAGTFPVINPATEEVLGEVADASKVGMTIEKEKIIVQENVRKVCELFNIDPYSSISEGTLIITVKSHKAQEVLDRLQDKGIQASIVGEVVESEQGMIIFDEGKSSPLVHPKVDPFWAAFGKAASGGK